MWDLVGRQPREFLAIGAAHMAEPLWLIAITSALIIAVVWLLQRRFPGGAAARHRRGPAVTTLVLLLLAGTVAVTAGGTLSEPVEAGLRRKPSARAMAIVVNRLSDVDRDGYGVGARPTDANPFDASVHPYAVDVPGNGVDEDGVGGDLPVADAAYNEGATNAPAWAWKPDVILVLLESGTWRRGRYGDRRSSGDAHPARHRPGWRNSPPRVLTQRLHLSVALSPVQWQPGRGARRPDADRRLQEQRLSRRLLLRPR